MNGAHALQQWQAVRVQIWGVGLRARAPSEESVFVSRRVGQSAVSFGVVFWSTL